MWHWTALVVICTARIGLRVECSVVCYRRLKSGPERYERDVLYYVETVLAVASTATLQHFTVLNLGFWAVSVFKPPLCKAASAALQ